MQIEKHLENIIHFSEFIKEKMTRKSINIVKKNWTIKIPGYTIQFNDIEKHPLIPRIRERTDLSLMEIKEKIKKAIEYLVKKNDKGFFKEKCMVEFFMKKSNFKLLIMINPENKYIRISTVLAPDMKTSNTIKWELNEEETKLYKFEVTFDEE
jgi:hypothetical protein